MPDTVRTLAEFQALLHPNIQNGMPDATVLQSQTARDLLLSIGSLLGEVVVDGSSTFPRTRAGVQAAVTKAIQLGLTQIRLSSGAYTWDTTTVTISTDNFTVVIDSGANITFPAGSSSVSAFTVSRGTVSTSSLLNASVSEGANTATLAAGGVATTGAVVGSYMWFVGKSTYDGVQVNSQVTRIDRGGISGQTLTFADPFYEGFLTTDAATVSRLTDPVKNVSFIVNGTFDATGNTGTTTRAISALYTVDFQVNGGRYLNFPAAGVWVSTGYGTHLLGKRHYENCGNANEDSEVMIWTTGFHVDNTDHLENANWNTGISWSNGGTAASYRGVGATSGRAFKISIVSHSVFIGGIANNSGSAYTGLAISLCSHHNVFVGWIVEKNASHGVWFQGNSCYNRVVSTRSQNNGGSDVYFEAGSNYNVYEGELTTLTDLGTGNVTPNRTLFLGAADGWMGVAGAPALAAVGSSANDYEKNAAMVFANGVRTGIVKEFYIPDDWNLSSITPTVEWAPQDGGAGNVQWQVVVASIAANGQIDTPFTFAPVVVSTAPAVADQLTLAALASGTPTTKRLRVGVFRIGGSDTYANNAWFMGLDLTYTRR